MFLAIAFAASFYLAARKATAGAPRGFQSFVELVVEFVDNTVRDSYHGTSKLIAPLALTIFGWVFLFNCMDIMPVDLFPALATGAGLSHMKVVPTTDLNITFGMSITVFLLIIYYSIRFKGIGGFIGELDAAPVPVEEQVRAGCDHPVQLRPGIRAASSPSPCRCRCDCTATCSPAR